MRISPPKYQGLRQAHTWEVYVAGSQLNLAANLARLAKRTAFVTKLPGNEPGSPTLDDCQAHGVDMSHVQVGGTRANGRELRRVRCIPRPYRRLRPREQRYKHNRAGRLRVGGHPEGYNAWSCGRHSTGLSLNCQAAASEYVGEPERLGCAVCLDRAIGSISGRPPRRTKAGVSSCHALTCLSRMDGSR